MPGKCINYVLLWHLPQRLDSIISIENIHGQISNHLQMLKKYFCSIVKKKKNNNKHNLQRCFCWNDKRFTLRIPLVTAFIPFFSEFTVKQVKILRKKIFFFQVWGGLFCEINELTALSPLLLCNLTNKWHKILIWADTDYLTWSCRNSFCMFMLWVCMFVRVFIFPVFKHPYVPQFSVGPPWCPLTKLTALPDWWITAPSRRLTCSYINKHTQDLHEHTETITGAALFTLETWFSKNKNTESAILHPFSHRKELRSRCLPDLFIFYAREIIIIMNKLFTVAVISSGAVMHWCKHIIASVGEFWTNVQKFGVGTIILMFLKSLMLTKAAFIWWKIQ